jgi:hypothetical protein
VDFWAVGNTMETAFFDFTQGKFIVIYLDVSLDKRCAG